ncbi:MAG: TIR domain-containing protein [Ginsengibacter sp.]
MAKEKLSKSKTKDTLEKPEQQKRTYIKQADVPLLSLDDALRIPQAILENYAGKPTSPLYVAKALNIDPKGGQFKLITGAAIAYGLIDGGAQATAIGITELTKRILRPKQEGGDLIARRESVLIPRVFKDFLGTYNGHVFPRPDIAVNVLEEMGVPREKASEILQRIESSAASVGFIEEVKGKKYVTLEGLAPAQNDDDVNSHNEDEDVTKTQTEKVKSDVREEIKSPVQSVTFPKSATIAIAIADDERRRKVFITHGKNKELVNPIKKLLEYGELIPIVSIDRQSVSKPVPEKVMDDMRVCGAAIIHVDAESIIIEKDGQEHVIINPNVLIEIGAAMAFYGRRFILLVNDGVKLPSNLQGLYEVRYSGETLDATATINLLEAIRDIKNYSLPTDANSTDQ